MIQGGRKGGSDELLFKFRDPIAIGAGFVLGFVFNKSWKNMVSALLSLPLATLLVIGGIVAIVFIKAPPVRLGGEFSTAFGVGVIVSQAS